MLLKFFFYVCYTIASDPEKDLVPQETLALSGSDNDMPIINPPIIESHQGSAGNVENNDDDDDDDDDDENDDENEDHDEVVENKDDDVEYDEDTDDDEHDEHVEHEMCLRDDVLNK
ncbi:hypothetical protein COBT_001646 [Conglomerata obtusa]